MQDMILQIKFANQAGLYYVALFSALALPDICAALESVDGNASKDKYIRWFNKHIAPRYNNFLDGKTCYDFRCSMLHQGSTQNPRGHYSRLIFIEPEESSNILHNNIINDALNIDVQVFCQDICEAAQSWWKNAATQSNVVTNLPRFVTRHPNGLMSYVVGSPVIS